MAFFNERKPRAPKDGKPAPEFTSLKIPAFTLESLDEVDGLIAFFKEHNGPEAVKFLVSKTAKYRS